MPAKSAAILLLTFAISPGRPLLAQGGDLQSRLADLQEGQSITDRGVTLTLHRKSAGSPNSEGWYPATSTGCGFSVLLPAPYNDFTSSATNPAGEVLKRHVIETLTADGAELAVVCMEPIPSSDPSIYPEQFAENLAADGRILRRVPTRLGNLSGLEISVRNSGRGCIDARVLVSKERAYELTIEYPAAAMEAAALARDIVFRSFTPSTQGQLALGAAGPARRVTSRAPLRLVLKRRSLKQEERNEQEVVVQAAAVGPVTRNLSAQRP